MTGRVGQALGKALPVQGFPVAGAAFRAGSLPAVVNLYILRAEIPQVGGNPFGIVPHFGGVDAVVIVIPGTPAGRGLVKMGFVQRLKMCIRDRTRPGARTPGLQCIAYRVSSDWSRHDWSEPVGLSPLGVRFWRAVF